MANGEVPDGWRAWPFDDCVLPPHEKKKSVQQNSYAPAGLYPVVDQGEGLIAGYTDDESLVYREGLPLILFGDHTRYFKYLGFPFATGADGTKLFRAHSDRFDAQYLYFALLALEIPSRGYSRHFKYLREQAILAPEDKKEQKAIVGVLSKLPGAVEAQDKIIATLKEFKAATLAKLFREGLRGQEDTAETAYGEIPAYWLVSRLDQCAEVQTGVAKGRKLSSGHLVERPYLRVANVQDGYLDLREIKVIQLRASEIDRFTLRDGDVLLTEGGDFDKLGRGFIWHGQVKDCVHQNHIFAVRPRREVLLPEFLTYLIQSPYGKAYFLNVAHKTTNLACINSTKLKELPVLLPPIEEQAEIASSVAGIDHSIDAATQKREALNRLFSSLLHLFMTGEVRVTPLMKEAAS